MDIQLAQLMLGELEREATNTRKLLHCIPDERAEWRPHPKSFPLNKLGSHIAELPKFLEWILAGDELDMSQLAGSRSTFNAAAEMIAQFDIHMSTASGLLEHTTNEQMMQEWTFRSGPRIIAQASRYDSIRNWMINHHIHHRGQLSVYLRLLDVPIPGMYGPSADDILAREAASAGRN